MAHCETLHADSFFVQKNKWMNQKIRLKYQSKKARGSYYRKKHNKTPKWKQHNIPRRTLTVDGIDRTYPVSLDGWNMQDFVPSSPYRTVDHWIHPMTETNLNHLYEDIEMQQHINDNENTVTHLEENEKLLFLLDAYLNQMHNHHGIQTSPDIQEVIRRYVWPVPLFSLQCIAGTHYLARTIHQSMNSEANRCEYSDNTDLNILEYIFIRGGALRDCHLLRQIRDIDLIVNIYELSRAFLQHLTKYHRHHTSKLDSKCIFWRRYLNKFVDKPLQDECPYMNYDHCDAQQRTLDVRQIAHFEHHIVTCDYLLNSRFIVDLLRENNSVFDIKKKYHGLHWELKLQPSARVDRMVGSCIDKEIPFDLVDQTGNSEARYAAYRSNCKLRGLDDTISNTVTKINEYKSQAMDMVSPDGYIAISIPLYPFVTSQSFEYIDFTINAFHIDLYSVLMNASYSNSIDYNWECKIYKKYGNDAVNRYNMMAMKDTNNKIIRCPSDITINETSGSFYFWRLVKLLQKFITQIENNVWKVDRKYMQHTRKQYVTWFNDEFIESNAQKFANRLLLWGIENKYDYVKRFKVFRFIGFDKHFRSKLRKYPRKLGGTLKSQVHWTKLDGTRGILKYCFAHFGYPSIGLVERKRGDLETHNGLNEIIEYP
eukprot:459429_1